MTRRSAATADTVAGAAALPGLAIDPVGTSSDRRPHRRRRVSALTVFWIVVVAILILPIALFLAVAFSPALLSQGPQWFTLTAFQQALTGQLLTGVLDSLVVGVSTAVLSAAVGLALSWVVVRTDAPGWKLATGVVFALLLAPSYLIALGWERLLEPNGVLDVLGVPDAGLRGVIYGPVGIVLVLTMKGIPFAFLAISNAVRGLGHEFEDALRVHGGGRFAAMRLNVSMLSPAIWAALAIVFAESVSDFGVASTLANDSHFTVATYTLYTAVQAFPVDFPVASAVSWVLLVLVALALLAQSRALRGRSFRVLGGRSRPALRTRLSPLGTASSLALLIVVIVVGVGVPAFGAVSASLISNLGSLGAHAITIGNYTHVIASPDLSRPLSYSAVLATITATVTLLMATVCARLLSASGETLGGRILDLVLLGAVALPGIVFAAGYIFAYNLPLTNALGIHLYGTTALLTLAYIATALPSTSRVLVGTMSQLQESMTHASRVHGSGAIRAWLTIVLPVVSRPLVSAWLLTFTATLLELPVSQLLSPPGTQPVSVGISVALGKYDFGGATAMEVLAILFALAVVAAGYALYRFVAPIGWRTIGKAR